MDYYDPRLDDGEHPIFPSQVNGDPRQDKNFVGIHIDFGNLISTYSISRKCVCEDNKTGSAISFIEMVLPVCFFACIRRCYG